MRGLEARIADLGAELPDQVQERLSAIRLWLAGREGDAAARAADRERIAELERALADDLATESSLRSALGSAEQAAEGVPETLRASVERRLRDFGRVRHRRRLLRACVVLLAVGIASTAALMLARSSANESRIDSACEAVLGAIESGQLGEARRLLNELEADAAIAMDPKVASARDQLVAKEAQRQNRRRDVQKLIELAGPADAASSRRELVEQAKARAVDADQARQASSWLESHERAVRLERDKGLAAGRRRLAELRARVTSHTLESGSRSDEMLNAWEVELNDIARNVTGLDELQAEITVIRETLQAKRDQLRSAREQEDCAERLDGIGRFASSPTSLKAALDEFQRRCPLDPQARSLSDAGRLGLPAWEAVAAWSSIEPRPSDALAIRPQRERDAVAKALGVYLKDHGQTPFLGECDAVNSLLRDAPGWSAWLEGKLGELGAFEWWCIELGGGVRWYCLSDPRRESSRNQGSKVIKTVKVLRGESMEETLMDFDKSKIVFEGPSPQRELAVRLRSLLEDCRRSSNDVKGALDALAAVRSAERVDGKFATELVRGILIEFASQAPQVLHGDLSGAIEALERVRLDGIDWIRPDEESSRQRSQEAWIELRKAVRPDEWMRKYVEALSAAARPFGRRYEPAGAIVGSPEGRQRFLPAPGWPGDASGEVYAVVPGIGDTRARLVVVGTARDGAVDLAPAAVVPAGSMLFRLSREQGP